VRWAETMEKITGPLIEYGLALVFANVLITRLGVPLPAIPTLVVAGALTQQGYLSVAAVIAGASVASVIGDLPWYYAGRRFGSRAINALCRIAVERDICARQAHDIFQRWGAPSLMIGRLIPGVARMAPPRLQVHSSLAFCHFLRIAQSARRYGRASPSEWARSSMSK
jgi:membrane protein DedA with SNARE-associated domain